MALSEKRLEKANKLFTLWGHRMGQPDYGATMSTVMGQAYTDVVERHRSTFSNFRRRGLDLYKPTADAVLYEVERLLEARYDEDKIKGRDGFIFRGPLAAYKGGMHNEFMPPEEVKDAYITAQMKKAKEYYHYWQTHLENKEKLYTLKACLLYTSPSPRDS